MKSVFFYLTLFSVGFGTTAVAQDRIIQVEPGLWQYTHTLAIPGLLSPMSEPKNECISAGEAKIKLSDLMSKMTKDGNCTFSNLKSNLNTIKFDLSCSVEVGGTAMRAVGDIVFKYGRTKIKGTAKGTVSFGENGAIIDASAEAARVGRC